MTSKEKDFALNTITSLKVSLEKNQNILNEFKIKYANELNSKQVNIEKRVVKSIKSSIEAVRKRICRIEYKLNTDKQETPL
jgi:hypothetical protein